MNTNEHINKENKIKDNLEKIVSGYFNQFLLKFDSFNDQLKIADVLLNVYKYRYLKMKNKFDVVNDIITDNTEEQKKFQEKLEKLHGLDAKLSQVEAKMQILNNIIGNIENNI